MFTSLWAICRPSLRSPPYLISYCNVNYPAHDFWRGKWVKIQMFQLVSCYEKIFQELSSPLPYHTMHSCPIHPICNGLQKGWRFATDSDGLPGSCNPSQIITNCLHRYTGSHVAKRDSRSELQVVYTYPWKSWRIVTIRDESPSWCGLRQPKTAC